MDKNRRKISWSFHIGESWFSLVYLKQKSHGFFHQELPGGRNMAEGGGFLQAGRLGDGLAPDKKK